MTVSDGAVNAQQRKAVGPWSDLALHTMGWRAFQDLCSQVCEVVLRRPVEIFREAQDGGQDAVFLIPPSADGELSIGTVQCKHTSDAVKRLKFSDLKPEVEHVTALVNKNQADTYILMTNMGVDAQVALEIRQELKRLGVRKPHVFGKQFVVRTVKGSPRLRAMVPQVYGLGDLTAILDERLSQQSRALLDQWVPKLKAYVPTKPHRQAVRSLLEHGIVLLLGNPSAGKSAIGAILSTIASETPNNTVLALTSPREFEGSWNPDDPSRFFWIDDAFGSNIVRQDYVQGWEAAFRKVQAAIGKGNKFLLTSRRHIYEAAKRGLGQRNLQVFIDGSAVTDVGALTIEEKEQILYNHINYGFQSQQWKTAVKPFLGGVAATENFLPGIAERLGHPSFTKGLSLREASLVSFMEEPREHLIDTINALDDTSRAALLLVYVHQGALNLTQPEAAATEAVSQLSGIGLIKILECFPDLQGSFLRKPAPGQQIWGFAHPTIADALTEILREKSHMVPALLRGATTDTILHGFVCEGITYLKDAMVVPAKLNQELVKRLSGAADETASNWSLFSFLAYRASDEVIGMLINAEPELFERNTWSSLAINSNPRVIAFSRFHGLGLLPDDVRELVASDIEKAAKRYDLSFLSDQSTMALIPPLRLVSLGIHLRSTLLQGFEEKITQIRDDADLDDEPEDIFRSLVEALDHISDLSNDDETADLVSDARHLAEEAIQDLVTRKEDRERNDDEEEVDWNEVLVSSSEAQKTPNSPERGELDKPRRSTFEDVDQS